jgi:hypothetical protein
VDDANTDEWASLVGLLHEFWISSNESTERLFSHSSAAAAAADTGRRCYFGIPRDPLRAVDTERDRFEPLSKSYGWTLETTRFLELGGRG